MNWFWGFILKGELRPPSAPGIAKPFPDPSVKDLQALILWITLQDSQVRLYPHLCCPSIRRYLANYRVTSEITGTLSFPSSMFSLVLKNLGFTHPLTYHIIPFSTCMSGGTQIFHSLTDLDPPHSYFRGLWGVFLLPPHLREGSLSLGVLLPCPLRLPPRRVTTPSEKHLPFLLDWMANQGL